MKRRSFVQKAILIPAVLVAPVSMVPFQFNEIMRKQKFNFMAESHPNLTLIKDFFTAYTNNDFDAIKKILAENIKWHIPGNHPLSGTKIGVNEVLDFFKTLSKASMKAEPIVMGVNDNYVIDCHRNWSSIENGENINALSCLLWKIENN